MTLDSRNLVARAQSHDPFWAAPAPAQRPSPVPDGKNHRNASRASIAPCLSLSSRYCFASMTVAGAYFTLQGSKNARISRRHASGVSVASGAAASATFHVGNEIAARGGLTPRVPPNNT